MSYLVLARKWRPTGFDEVVGQSHVTRTLENAIQSDRVAHALLFTGSRGIGKTSCARILAKALNCDQGPTANPCGVCNACKDIAAGRSVDVFEIDGASNNGVEQIREIREAVKFVSTRGKRKVYIIDEVHMLSTAAFNALLKTLEEPPPHVLFVFATTEPHKLPDTIISRCQRYDFKRIPERAIVEAIGNIAAAEGLEVEPAALSHIAREAKGGMRDSLSLLDQVIAFCGTHITEKATREVLGIADRRVLQTLTEAVLAGQGQVALQVVDDLFRHGLDLQKFAAEFVKHLRDLMVIKVCQNPDRLVDLPPGELAAAAGTVQSVSPARIHRLFNALMAGAEEVSRSPFPKLVFEMTLLRLCEQGPTLPLAQVLDGLARLEARLDTPVAPDASPVHAPPDYLPDPPVGLAASWNKKPTNPARPSTPDEPEPASPGPQAQMSSPAVGAPEAPESGSVQPARGSAAVALDLADAPEYPPHACTLTRKATGSLAHLKWPKKSKNKSAFDAPVAAVRKVAGRPHLRVVPAPPERQPEPRPTPDPEPIAHAEVSAIDPEAEPLDFGDGRSVLEHFAHLVAHSESFIRFRLRNDVYVQRFDGEALHFAVQHDVEVDDLITALAHAARRVLGQVPQITYDARGPHEPPEQQESIADWEQRLAAERREAQKQVARQDPAVQAAVSILGAEITGVDIEPK